MRKVLIVCIFCLVTIILSGCSKVALEREPFVIKDSPEASMVASEPGIEQDNLSDQEDQDHNTVPASNSQENPSDTPSNDGDKGSSGANETMDTFKGIVMIEGMEEEVNYRTYHSEYGYQMAYDADRFTVTSENGIDTYMAENMNPDLYPYVFVNITRSENPDDGARSDSGNLYVFDEYVNKTLSTSFPKDNVKIGDYDAIHFKGIDGSDWNSLVTHIYLIDSDKYYYVIMTHSFLEASEGYGVRIKAMLDTLVIY